MKLEGKLQDREFRPIWKQVKNVFKKVVRKKNSNCTEKRNASREERK